MIFAVISDVVWQALIAAVLAGFIEWVRRATVKKVDDVKIVADLAAKKVDDVKIVADLAAKKVDDVKIVAEKAVEKVEQVKVVAEKAVEKVEEVRVVADEINKLAHGNIGKQLKIAMITAQTLAATEPTEVNKQLAKSATEKCESHLATEKEQKSAAPPA